MRLRFNLNKDSQLLSEIELEVQSGHYSAAEPRLQAVLVENPENGRARELLGTVLFRTGRAIEAREQLEYASSLVVLSPASEILLAECYLGEQHRRLALEMLLNVSRRPTADAHVLRKAALAADSCDHPWVSKAICERSLKRFPDDPQTYYELGYYCARLGSPSLMEANARRAIDLEPSSTCFRLGLAKSLASQDRIEDAYELVRVLGPREIATVCCNSCVTDLLGIYEASGDSLRCELCRSRLQQQGPDDSKHGP